MSDALATVFKPDGSVVGYSCYQGSADVIHPGLHEDIADWRNPSREDWDRHGHCDHSGEPGIIYSSYGGGDHWAGLYCPECMVIIGPLSPYGVDEGWSAPPPHGPDPGPEVFDGEPFPDDPGPPETVRVPRDVLEPKLGKKAEAGLLFDLERATLSGVETATFEITMVYGQSVHAKRVGDEAEAANG